MSFMMVDKVQQISEMSINTCKLLSIAEDVYEIHFPYYPVLPAVLLLEHIKQSIDIFIQINFDAKFAFIKRINKLKVYRSVFPGDIIHSKIIFTSKENNNYYFDAIIYHNSEITTKIKNMVVTAMEE